MKAPVQLKDLKFWDYNGRTHNRFWVIWPDGSHEHLDPVDLPPQPLRNKTMTPQQITFDDLPGSCQDIVRVALACNNEVSL